MFTFKLKNRYTSIFESQTQIQFYEYFRLSKNKLEFISKLLYLDTTNILKKNFKGNLFIFLSYTDPSNVLCNVPELFRIILVTSFKNRKNKSLHVFSFI